MLVAAAGCEEKTPQPAADAGKPKPATQASVTLRVAVTEDKALAEAIRRLRGEWAELSGGELVVQDGSADDRSAESPSIDLVIFPSRRLGELCEAGRLRPIRDRVLRSDQLNLADYFPAVRERLMVYGERVMALPLGCVVPAMVSDEVEPAPRTWSDLQSRSVGIDGGGKLARAYLFLAAAASGGSHPSRKAWLLEPDTMKPRLSEPPFVRVLAAGVAQSTRRGERRGEAQIVWPTRDPDGPPPLSGNARVTPLPGATEVYNPVAGQFESVDEGVRRVPLLATSGRLVGVTTSSRNAASAFRLAAWLASPQNSRQLARAGASVASARVSLARQPDDWTGCGDASLGAQFSAALAEALGSRRAVLVPRIVGVDRYLESLQGQIGRALTAELSPEEALAAAAADWERITDEIGRDRQRRAYRRHLGLEPYEPAVR